MNALRSLLFLLLASLPAAHAQDYLYTQNFPATNTATITSYRGSGGAVVIPGAIAGLTVTRIGNNAFVACTSLVSVVIPSSVTSIGQYAFQQCTALISVVIPDSVTNIGIAAFASCISLPNVTIPNQLPILEEGVFSNCRTLPGVMIPNSVTRIERQAFGSCTNLSGITIPDSVVSIATNAFVSCRSLTSVTIPRHVATMGIGVFAGCYNLGSITVDPDNAVYSSRDGVLFNRSQTALLECPGGKAGNYTIPDGVTTIGDGAFIICTNLTSLTFPGSVTNFVLLGYPYLFSACTRLTAAYFMGDAPSVTPPPGNSNNKTTIYYLPGTKNWAETFCALPTSLWDPHAASGDGCFGVQSNRFGFTIVGATNLMVVVEACADLGDNAWIPLQTNTLVDGSSYFDDAECLNYPNRYYRFRPPW